MARAELLERYEALPMPTTADEHWRFTDLRGFDPDSFVRNGRGSVPGTETRLPEGMLDVDQPTEPSIWSWISRFISTAYSSGSSFVIGSTKPETIIAVASASERPRDIR